MATLFETHPEVMTPLLNIVVEEKVMLDAFIDVVGRSSLEAVLQCSSAEIGGPPHQGKAGGDVFWHVTQAGVVTLPTQKVRVTKPRLRQKGGGKVTAVSVSAYSAVQQGTGLGEKLAAILLRGVGTRVHVDVIPAIAETCGRGREPGVRGSQ